MPAEPSLWQRYSLSISVCPILRCLMPTTVSSTLSPLPSPRIAYKDSRYFEDTDFRLVFWVESNLIRVVLPTPSHALIRLLIA